MLHLLSLLCAGLIGFTAHRASLCNVRAVAEILNGRSAHMLGSLAQAVLWMATLSGALTLVLGLVPQPTLARAPLAWAALGGWCFGLGAAINGGCSLSTLHRLADGDMGMLATLAGLAAGVAAWLAIRSVGAPAELIPITSPWLRWPAMAPWALALLFGWALLRIRLFVNLARREGAPPWCERALAPSWHLSVAAAVIGLAGGLLYAVEGSWSYTSFLRNALLHHWADAATPPVWHGALVAGLVGGMGLSAWHRGSITLRLPLRRVDWLRHGLGGAFMGLGAALIPGGNDTLLLAGLPALAVAALWAYAMLVLGIAAGLWALRVTGVPMSPLTCTPDGCSEGSAPASPHRPTASPRR